MSKLPLILGGTETILIVCSSWQSPMSYGINNMLSSREEKAYFKLSYHSRILYLYFYGVGGGGGGAGGTPGGGTSSTSPPLIHILFSVLRSKKRKTLRKNDRERCRSAPLCNKSVCASDQPHQKPEECARPQPHSFGKILAATRIFCRRREMYLAQCLFASVSGYFAVGKCWKSGDL